MQPSEVATWLGSELGRVVAARGVPGAAAAVLVGDEVVDAAAGVLSTGTGVAATADSVFQVGSITKLWTATLVMQLVEEGLLDLDAPVRDHLPGFRTSDPVATERITARQLLCHTAGFEGDVFTDTGRGDDAVEKYVAAIAGTPQLVPPGEVFSYNNAGYVVLGRLVEVLRGRPFDAVLTERLVEPLGLTHVAPSPYEAILHRAAVGHVGERPDGTPEPARQWALVRSNAPAGSMLAMRARDLLGFVRLHLAGGRAPDGTQVLGAAAVAAMQERQTAVPDVGTMGSAWGLGWSITETDGGTVVEHDGGTIGQAAFLRVVPEHGVAVALLTNGGDVLGSYEDVVVHLVRELTGITLPARPEPPADPLPVADPARYTGRYADAVHDVEVREESDGTLWLEQTPKGILAEIGEPPFRTGLVPLRGDSLIALEQSHGMHPVYAFLGDDGSGRAAYLHHGRAVARTDDPS
ncbi:serine hydrolase [Nocardioides sp. TF02-7]|uniref:serine hydrolase n=1 Tax=Nocardioides sp. TF02-7 TaxID=2917724 RepID=UPI001F06DE67|nr:serine hydrolase [Nocardioides sp. TF02-7]UMG93226.1 serine hydrolase [Nocardioides sp. TF02-7]